MKFALHPGIQGTMNGNVQWLETSTNFAKPDDECLAPKFLQCIGGSQEKREMSNAETDAPNRQISLSIFPLIRYFLNYQCQKSSTSTSSAYKDNNHHHIVWYVLLHI